MMTNSTSNIKVPYREQLNKLPEVFTLPEMRRVLGYSTTSAHQTIARWIEKKLIDPLANRAGVYFNLEKNKNSRQEHLQLAISKKYPTARLIGPQVLTNYGWATQIQHYSTLAVNIPPIKGSTSAKDGYLSIPEIEFQYKSKKWWLVTLEEDKKREKKNIYINGFESITPALALVDMWINREKNWFPDEDDLYLEDFPNAAEDIVNVCNILKLDYRPLLEHINIEYISKSSILEI